MDTLAKRAAYLRDCARIGQREADRLAGVGRGWTGGVERGERRDPRGDYLDKIARLYGVKIEWLLRGEGRQPSERAVRTAVATRKAAAGAGVAA